jgi:hypothetical protein
VPSGSASVAPWTLKTPTNIVRGMRTIKIEVTDGRNKNTATIQVNVQGETTEQPDDLSGGCSTGGNGSLLLALLALVGCRRRVG